MLKFSMWEYMDWVQNGEKSHTKREKMSFGGTVWDSGSGLAGKSLSAFKYASHPVFYQASFGLIPVSKSHL